MAAGGVFRPPRLRSLSTEARLAVFLGLSLPPYIVISQVDSTAGLIACGAVSGIALCLFEVAWNAVMQERTPDKMLGRVYALGSWLSFAARVMGVAACGAFAAVGGVSSAIAFSTVAMGVSIAATAALCALSRRTPVR